MSVLLLKLIMWLGRILAAIGGWFIQMCAKIFDLFDITSTAGAKWWLVLVLILIAAFSVLDFFVQSHWRTRWHSLQQLIWRLRNLGQKRKTPPPPADLPQRLPDFMVRNMMTELPNYGDAPRDQQATRLQQTAVVPGGLQGPREPPDDSTPLTSIMPRVYSDETAVSPTLPTDSQTQSRRPEPDAKPNRPKRRLGTVLAVAWFDSISVVKRNYRAARRKFRRNGPPKKPGGSR